MKLNLFWLLYYVLICLLGLSYSSLFMASDDFTGNIELLEYGYSWLKSPWYSIYKYCFSSIIKPHEFLIALWALIPLLLTRVSGNVLVLVNSRQPSRFVIYLLIYLAVSWNTCFRFFVFNIPVPTAHFLFQSLASALLLQSFFFYSSRLSRLFLFLAVSFHYSTLLPVAICMLCSNLFFNNPFASHRSIKYSMFTFRLVLIITSLFSSFLIYPLIQFLKGITMSDSLGVSQSDARVVILLFFFSVSSFLFVSLGLVTYAYNSKKLQLLNSYLTLSLTAAILSGLSMSFLLTDSVGLAYRLAYPVFVWSSPLFSISLVSIVRFFAKPNLNRLGNAQG